MAVARRVSMFSRRIETRLAPATVDWLLGQKDVLSEGGFDGARYAGTTMLTADVRRGSELFSDPPDAVTARRVAALVPTDSRLRNQAKRLAHTMASETAGDPLRNAVVDVRARANGTRICVDLDLEAERSEP